MTFTQWIQIYLPILVLLFIIIPQSKRTKRLAFIAHKRISSRKETPMDLTIFEPYVGKQCQIHLLDHVIFGTLVTVEDRWLKVEVKKSVEIINSEFVQNIKVITE